MRFPTLVLALATLTFSFPFKLRQARECNGNPLVCDRKYSNVSYIGTHNSAFVGDLEDPRVNQHRSVTDQLDAGIRFMTVQIHEFLGMLRLCHTECILFDAGKLEDFLEDVKLWMDSHPAEVVTVLIANGDNSPASRIDEAFADSGLKAHAFVPSTSPDPLPLDAWPTLAEIIDSQKRLVTFLDAGADELAYPYLLSEFAHYFFETPFETTDPSFNQCDLHRPAGSDGEGRMYIMNHFLQHEVLPDVFIPAAGDNFVTNAATGEGSIGDQVATCVEWWGRRPNFVLVDQFQRGLVFEAQAALNGF